MAARPTVFNGEEIEPAATFSGSWTTVMRPDFPPSKPIAKLKDLHLRTPLARAGKPSCVLLVPEGRYAAVAARVRTAIQQKTGVEVPLAIIDDIDVDPEALLDGAHVVTFGNMATNPFLHHLYSRWLTLLDLKWPGREGHALLSLHNPFGNGRNAILVGGSDKAGVAESARILAEAIAASPDGSLGWLHDIALGEGQTAPEPWNGDRVAYWPGTPGNIGSVGSSLCFGWNSIATYAALYYMTGREEYADHFKRLAMSRPGHVPEDIRADYSYWNPANPIVETYHYYSFLIPCLWDLIEEAPVFTDEERIFITNKLVEQQDHYDPKDNFGTPNGSRHSSYQMLNIYTGSRYLSKYYPEQRWFQRIANIRAAFDAWKTSRTWGELDLVKWMPTSIEFVLNFFLLDDSANAFTQCGGTEEMISPQLHCWTGKPLESVSQRQSLSMMHKAAWMLGDGSWVWLARQAPYDTDRFRIGQSWWPDERLAPTPPARVLNRVSSVPLQRTYWQRAGRTIPLEQGSQFLVYRDSVDTGGDYLRLDVAWFCDRNAYHLVTPDALRIGGVDLINGLGSLLVVRRQGLLETVRTPQMAAVTGKVGMAGGAAMRFFTPNMSFSSWRRTVLHRTGTCIVFVDEVTAVSDGPLDVTLDWKITGAASASLRDGVGHAVSSAVDVAFAGVDTVDTPEGNARLVVCGVRKKGETMRALSILSPRRETVAALRPLGENTYAYARQALVFSGSGRTAGMRVAGAGAYVDAGLFLAAELTALEVGNWRLRAEHPVTLVWNLTSGKARVDTLVDSALTVNGLTVPLKKGVNDVTLPVLAGLPASVTSAVAEAGPADPAPVPQAISSVDLQGNAAWERDGDVSCLRFAEKDDWALVPGNLLPAGSDFTVEAWIRPERFITREEAKRTRISCQAVTANWAVQGDQRAWMMMLAHDKLSFWVSRDGGHKEVSKAGHPTPLKLAWNHVAVVYEEGKATLVVNGEAGEATTVGAINNALGAITFGRYQVGYPFSGRMCGVRIFDRALPVERLGAHAGAGPAVLVPESPEPAFVLRPPEQFGETAGGDWEPVRLRRMPGKVRLLRVAPAPCGGTIWAACDYGLLVLLNADASAKCVVQLPDTITSLCVAPDRETCERVAAVVGLDNDEVAGIDGDGNVLWREKAEVHSRFWLDGHWRAPWFTDPKSCHGVLDLRFMRWRKGAPAEIALGRACTVELRALDGKLIERLPLMWGDRAALGESLDREGRPMLTAANWHRSLGANMQCVTAERKTGGTVYHKLPGDYTRIPGHGQGFLFHQLADLDGDGREEFITALCGTWNDVAVYDARSQTPKWVRTLGPWNRSATPLLCGVSTGDVDGDGKGEVFAAARNGWAWLFDAKGELRWAVQSEAPAESAMLAGMHALVGSRDGTLRAYDAQGGQVAQGGLSGAVTQLAATEDSVIAGTNNGVLAILPLPGASGARQTPPVAESAKMERIRCNGSDLSIEALPARDGRRLYLFPLRDGDGVYGGDAEIAFFGKGGVRFLLGDRELTTCTGTAGDSPSVTLGPAPLLENQGALSVWCAGGADLKRLDFRKQRAGSVLKPYAGSVPRERWLMCQAEDCLESSSGFINKKGGYLDNATVLYGFGKEPSQADWALDVPEDGRYALVIRYATTYEPVLAGLEVDGAYPDSSMRIMRLPPTTGWGYEEDHWRNGVLGGGDGGELSLRLSKGRHIVSLLSLKHAFNIDWLALVPLVP